MAHLRLYNITCPECGEELVVHQAGHTQRYVDVDSWNGDAVDGDYVECFKTGERRCGKQYTLTFTGLGHYGIDFKEVS